MKSPRFAVQTIIFFLFAATTARKFSIDSQESAIIIDGDSSLLFGRNRGKLDRSSGSGWSARGMDPIFKVENVASGAYLFQMMGGTVNINDGKISSFTPGWKPQTTCCGSKGSPGAGWTPAKPWTKPTQGWGKPPITGGTGGWATTSKPWTKPTQGWGKPPTGGPGGWLPPPTGGTGGWGKPPPTGGTGGWAKPTTGGPGGWVKPPPTGGAGGWGPPPTGGTGGWGKPPPTGGPGGWVKPPPTGGAGGWGPPPGSGWGGQPGWTGGVNCAELLSTPIPCTYNPHARTVCGSDGVTYPNSCFLDVQTCVSNGAVKLAHEGACTGTRQQFPFVTSKNEEEDNEQEINPTNDFDWYIRQVLHRKRKSMSMKPE